MRTGPTGRLVLVAGGLVLVAACTGSGDTTATTSAASPPATAAESSSAPVTSCTPLADLVDGDLPTSPPTREPFPWDREDPVVADGFDADAIVSGGPPPDGIVPIDDPCFDRAEVADAWLEDQSPVMVLDVDGDRRAYPLAIMTQHEIVNDVVGGVPVTVTYCPLCNSALAFERTVDGTVLDFGTSGRLFQSNLVMYDRQTRTLWSQFTGEAVVGADHVGTTLERLPTSLLGWGEALAADVEGGGDMQVLSPDSVPGRDYGRNPYPGYEGSGDSFLFDGPRDDRVGPNTRVVGLGGDAGDTASATAVTLPHLEDVGVVAVEVGGEPVTVWWAPGQASALDEARVDDGVDVGSTAAFDPRVDGDVLTFTPGDDATVVESTTGSTFTLLGEAVDGPLAGTTLTPVAHDDTFWFVWFAFRPDTVIVPPPG